MLIDFICLVVIKLICFLQRICIIHYTESLSKHGVNLKIQVSIIGHLIYIFQV